MGTPLRPSLCPSTGEEGDYKSQSLLSHVFFSFVFVLDLDSMILLYVWPGCCKKKKERKKKGQKNTYINKRTSCAAPLIFSAPPFFLLFFFLVSQWYECSSHCCIFTNLPYVAALLYMHAYLRFVSWWKRACDALITPRSEQGMTNRQNRDCRWGSARYRESTEKERGEGGVNKKKEVEKKCLHTHADTAHVRKRCFKKKKKSEYLTWTLDTTTFFFCFFPLLQF